MAATYDSLRALSRQTMKKLLDVQEWRKFLAFASRSFKLPFPAQVLAYAQRPDAAALMKSSDWEAVYGRPVKKGCHGVPVPEGRGKKLVYYYDIADTRETDESRPVPLWHVRPENQKGIGKALESYLGKLEDASGFAETLLAAARKTVACTLDDRLDDLAAHSPGSLLEELDSDNLLAAYRTMIENSVGYMLLSRCGLDPSPHFIDEDFYGLLDFGMALPDLRAIALALGYVKDLLTDEMFVGPQRVDFMRKVREGFRGDIYLTAARYLLEDEKDAGLWERILLGTQCVKTEELLFAMSVLPDFAQAERALRPQLSVLLGSGRTVPAIGNMRLFAWLIAHAAPHVKTLRGKDTALFRAICALPASNVKPGSKPYIVLESHGYTPLEIACLNMQAALAPESKLGPDSLVTEKIVVGLFQTALGQPVPLPEEVYPALEWLFRKYSRFRIKCYGCGTLADALKEGARIQEPATFAWFTKLAGIGHPALDGFDILDSKWDSLAGSMDQDKYKGLFERDLHSGLSPEDLTARITRYDQLTGGDYKTACTGEAYSSCFSLLVNNGLVDLWACFQESLDSEGNVKSPDAMGNIRRYLKGISTAQAYRFYEKFFSEYGMPGLKRFWNWEHRDFKESLYRPNYSYYSRSESLHLKRDFLDIDGHRQLLDWLQDYCFCYEPEKYAGLVSEILRDGFAPELLSPAEQRELFDLAISRVQVPDYVVRELKSRYLTEQEQQADRAAIAARKQEAEERKKREELQAMRDRYTSAENWQGVLKFLESYRNYHSKQPLACRIAREGLPSRLAAGQLEHEELTALLAVYALLLKNNAIEWPDVQEQIQKLKEDFEHDNDSAMCPAC